MTGILKVDQWKDSGDNALMTSDGAGVLTANAGIVIPSGATITNNGTATGFGGGKINQVVNFTTSTELSSGSSSYVDTNLVASITPSSASSRIYIQAFSICAAERSSAESSFQWKLLRDATDIWASGSQGYHAYAAGTSAINLHFAQTLLYIDSPSSTSSLSYKIQAKTNSGSTFKFQYQSSVGSLILMEVLA